MSAPHYKGGKKLWVKLSKAYSRYEKPWFLGFLLQLHQPDFSSTQQIAHKPSNCASTWSSCYYMLCWVKLMVIEWSRIAVHLFWFSYCKAEFPSFLLFFLLSFSPSFLPSSKARVFTFLSVHLLYVQNLRLVYLDAKWIFGATYSLLLNETHGCKKFYTAPKVS